MTYILKDTKLKEKVNKFCYLGSVLKDNGTSSVELEKRKNNGMEVIGMLNSILWSNLVKLRH
jgi:hypothetical protein